jgi:prepilin-type N-terminal cleavage/methylation domain-containing protein
MFILRQRASGFTLVELVATLTIAAILAAVAGPRLVSSQTFAARGYADDIASALRQARAVAMASGCAVRFTINSGGYSALQRAPSGTHCAGSGGWVTPVLRGDGRRLAAWPPAAANLQSGSTITFGIDGALAAGATTVVIGPHVVSVDAGGWVQRQ